LKPAAASPKTKRNAGKLSSTQKRFSTQPGTDVMISKIFSPKTSAKNGVFDSKQS
jgi:hypothetical protein